VFLVVERFLALRTDRVIPPEVFAAAMRGEAVGGSVGGDSAAARLVASWRGGVSGEALKALARAEVVRLQRGLHLLDSVVAAAPLLGLLGTVQGMIGAFDTVASGAANNASYYEELASNIAIALITTFQGLVVAIPCVSIYGYLRNRVDALAGECANNAEEIVTLVEKSGRKGGK